tara:strand:+ start:202 stop:849 length:648 start_codon:yes stop_codon:yes gene_type:complete
MFFSSVFLCAYLFNRHNTYQRQQNRKRSQPLPPIGNLEADLSNETHNNETKTSDGESQPPAHLKNPGNWRQSVSEMRKKKQIEPALHLCKSKFPLYTAYRETTLILKSILQNEGPSQAKIQDILSQLYKTAAIAELIHMKKSDENKRLPDKVKISDITLLEKIPIDYYELGYSKLPLLTKKDTRVLVSHWGEPRKHDTPRNLYDNYLTKLISSEK